MRGRVRLSDRHDHAVNGMAMLEATISADAQDERTTRVSGGILLFVAGVSMCGIMDGLGKLLATYFPLLQLVWARSAFAVPVILASAAPAGWPNLLRCER